MSDTQIFTGTLVVVDCCSCHMIFGMTADFDEARRNDHKTFTCPAGHKQHYAGKSDLEKEREKRERAEQQRDWANARATAKQDQLDASRRSNAALKGVVTKQKKRASAGVCACCNRTFQNVKRHMDSQHPDYVAGA